MVSAGFLNLPPWQDKLQLILSELDRTDLLRIPVLGTENVEHPWVALEPEEFFSAVSTGIIFTDDYRLKKLPEKIITVDTEIAIRRLLAGKTSDTFYRGCIGSSYPFLKMLTDDKKRISRFYVQNDAVAGYILSQMESESYSLDKAIAAAQWEKIASSNPSPNLHGIVTRNRLILQIAEIFGYLLAPEKIPTLGISSLSLDDVKIANFMGFSIRLLGMAELTKDGVRASVEPCMLPCQYFLAQAKKGSENFYAVSDKEQALIYSCSGTSFETQVKGLISDLDEVSKLQVTNRRLKVVSEVKTFSDRFYLRFSIVNLTSTLAQILNLFSTAGIEIEEIIQPKIVVSQETESNHTVIFLTAKTEQTKLSSLINRIKEQIKLATVVSCFKLFR